MNLNLAGTILLLAGTALLAQAPATPEPGRSVFRRDCAFCHGPDAGGGESGPDLTRSKLVGEDVAGSKIAPLVRAGVPDRGMPPFRLPDAEMDAVVRFIHKTKADAESKPGAPRGVDVADLQTGNAAAGKKYFEGAGGCVACHSPSGDLSHIASKYRGLGLEQHMLYPRGAKAMVTVTPRGGLPVTGTLRYRDEFTVALEDASGKYRSWAVEDVKFTIDDPAQAHVALFEKYTDADIHNLMAYLQTLR